MRDLERELLSAVVEGEHVYLKSIKSVLSETVVTGRLFLGSVWRVELKSPIQQDLPVGIMSIEDCFVRFGGMQNQVKVVLTTLEQKMNSLVLLAHEDEDIPADPVLSRILYIDLLKDVEVGMTQRNLEVALVEI